MMRIVDILYSIPFIFIVIFLVSVLSEEEVRSTLAAYGINQVTIFYFVIGALYWLTMASVVRGQVISLKHEQYIVAARTIGASQRRIIFRHLVPNLLSVVIVYLTLTIPSVMLFEAFLSFLGLGVAMPIPSLIDFPSPAARIAREIERAKLKRGEELTASKFLALLAERMPYLDGGRLFNRHAKGSPTSPNRGACPRC